MTSPQRSLHPASGDDRGSLLSTLELVARGRMQLAQIVGTVVGQRMPFEPGPQVLHGVQVQRIGPQECDLDISGQAVQILAHQAAAVRFQAIPDDQQRLLQMGLERLEEFDDFFFLDAALVQPEQAVGAAQASDDRDVVPVEVKLNDGRVPLGGQGAHPRGTLADARFVHKYDQSALSTGFF
jgi:hypothetical protein